MTELEQIKCVHQYTIYTSEGWKVVKYRAYEDKKTFTACGKDLPESAECKAILYGEWVASQKYGKQFQVKYSEMILPTSRKGVAAYLRSLKVGIGQKKSDLIYDAFGEQIWEVLEHAPERLTSVKGISVKTAEKLVQRLEETRLLRSILAALKGQMDVTMEKAKAIANTFGENSIKVIADTPY